MKKLQQCLVFKHHVVHVCWIETWKIFRSIFISGSIFIPEKRLIMNSKFFFPRQKLRDVLWKPGQAGTWRKLRTVQAFLLRTTIVIIRKWLWNPANFKETNKYHKIYDGRSTTLHNLLFWAHTLRLKYVTATFPLASSSGTNHDLLCFVQGQGQKSEQKHRTKNFAKLHNHLLLLTMEQLVPDI